MSPRRFLLLAFVATFVAASSIGCSSEPAAAVAASPSSTPNGTSTPPASSSNGSNTSNAQAAAGARVLGTGGVTDLVGEYERRCRTESQESLGCEALRSLIVAELTGALHEIEKIGDERATDVAFAALDLVEEPDVLIAAARVLGHSPETPNLASKMVPLMLESPYSSVQSMAAMVLMATPEADFQDLGRMWSDNHRELIRQSAYDEYPDFPTHYATMGFPKYAGAEWFSPADSDQSIGWSVKADAAAVAKWYGDTLHAELLDVDKWNEVYLQQAQILLKLDPSKMTRMEQLMERLAKGDQAAMAEIEKLQKQIDADGKQAEEAIEKSITKAALISGTFARDARWIIAAKKGERISRLVIVFSIPSIQRTVIKEVWDLSDYPSAWPPPRKPAGDGSQ